MDEKKPVKRARCDGKAVHFCAGEQGLFPWPIDEQSCPLFADMEWDVMTMCIGANCDHAEVPGEGHSPLPFAVGVDDLRCFLWVVSRDVCAPIRASTLQMVTQSEVNFMIVCRMLEFFLVPKTRYVEMLLFLEHHDRFASAVSCLSAFHLVGQTLQGVPHGVLFQMEFDEKLRLKLAHLHGLDAVLYRSERLDVGVAAAAVGVERGLLYELLRPNVCVLGGGGAVRLGCEWSSLPRSSDLDLFVLKGPAQEQEVERVVSLLRATGRQMFAQDSSNSVFVALGGYGVRRIQVIAASVASAEELVEGFDVLTTAAWYDGTCLHVTAGARHSWLKRKVCVSRAGYSRVRIERLLRLREKGFRLSRKAEGFTAKAESADPLLAQACPFLVDEALVPPIVQHANLLKSFGLSFLAEGEAIRFVSTPRDGASFCNIYQGTLLDYLSECRLADAPPANLNGTLYFYIVTDYCFDLHGCTIRTPAKTEGEVELDVSISSPYLHQAMTTGAQTCFAGLLSTKVTTTPDTQSLKIVCLPTVELYCDGFPRRMLPAESTLRGTMVVRPRCVILKPNNSPYATRLLTVQWQAARIDYTAS